MFWRGSLLAVVSMVPLLALAMIVKDAQVTLEKIEEFQSCLREQTEARCHLALEKWVTAHPEDSFKAAKMAQTDLHAQFAAGFFEKAFSSKQGDCKDESVKKFVIEGLRSPEAQKELIGRAQKIAFEHCFELLKPTLVDEVKSSSPSAFKKNACGGLIKAKALSGLKLKYCQSK